MKPQSVTSAHSAPMLQVGVPRFESFDPQPGIINRHDVPATLDKDDGLNRSMIMNR